MKDIVIVGAGGFAREVAWLIKEINTQDNTWNFLGYIESERTLIGQPRGDAFVIETDEWLLTQKKEIYTVIGIGNPQIVDRIYRNLIQNKRLRFPNLIHPSVILDQNRIQLGVGNIICAGNILTTDIKIGSFSILNLASTYGHDVTIGDCCVINPGVNISGGVTIGDRCLLGTGSLVLEKLTISNDVIVGGGAVVTKFVDPGLCVVGIPAKPLH